MENQNQNKVRDAETYEAGHPAIFRRLFFSQLFAHGLRINKAVKARQEHQQYHQNAEMNSVSNEPEFEILPEDVPKLSKNKTMFDWSEVFLKKMQSRKRKDGGVGSLDLFKGLLHTFKSQIISGIVIFALLQCFIFGQTFLFQYLIESLENNDYDSAYLLAGMFLLVIYLNATTYNYYGLDGRILGAKIKFCLISSLFSKIFTLSQHTITKKDLGKVINMLSNDFNLIEIKFPFIYTIAFFPLVLIGFGAVFVVRLGFQGFIMIGFMIMFFPIQIIFNRIISHLIRQANVYKDERIGLAQELVGAIKFIKINGWETQYSDKIAASRAKEQKKLYKLIFFRALFFSFSQAYIVLGLLITFFVANQNHGLTLAVVISSLQFITYLRDFLKMANLGFDMIADFRVVLERFCDFYNTPNLQMLQLNGCPEEQAEIKKANINLCQSSEHLNIEKQENLSEDFMKSNSLISLRSFSGYWGQNENPAIQNISLQIQPSKFYGLTGPVGCGKTTLLSAILGELPYKKGQMQSRAVVSYLEQEPLLFAGTIQENIVNSQSIDKEKYEVVIKATCLALDFQILPEGDQTIVGEHGVTLSGGQKARVGLARALYKDADFYLLDDPFAAVDTKIAKNIFENVCLGYLKDKAFILSTHQVRFLTQCDELLIMEKGKITKQVSRKQQQELQQILQEIEQKKKDEGEVMSEDKPIFHMKKKKQQIGKITFKMFFKYALSSSRFLFFLVILLFFISEALMVSFLRLMSLFDQQQNNETGLSIEMFWGLGFIFVGGYFIMTTIRNFLLHLNFVKCSSLLHDKMLHSLCRSKSSYFDTTSSGQLFSKFSNDIGVLDLSFIYAIESGLLGPVMALISLVNIVQINLYFLIPFALFLVLLVVFYFLLEKFVLESKRIDLESKSPVYSKLEQITSGIMQIKMFINESAYMKKINYAVTQCTKANIFYWMSGKLLSINVNFAVIGIMVILCFAGIPMIYLPEEYSISILFMEGIMLQVHWSFINIILAKSLFQSAVRCMNLIQIPQEKPFFEENDKQFSFSVSNQQLIKLQKLSLRYREETQKVLKNIDFTAKAGQKVGIVGRSGAGKSSIIAALLRINEPEQGSIYNFSGFDGLKLGLHTLRSQMAVVPQKSVFLKGTIRKNLVPFGQASDSEILEALEKVGLKEKIISLTQGLDTQVSDSQSYLSVGQKQLLCLARATLRKTSIIILDEATSHIDKKTDIRMHNVLKQSFKQKTVITIAHHLEAIADYDKVFVMSNGEIVQKGSPYKLLQKKGEFYQMVKNSREEAKGIEEIARQAHEERKARNKK